MAQDPTRRGLRKQDLPEEADAIVIGAGAGWPREGKMMKRGRLQGKIWRF